MKVLVAVDETETSSKAVQFAAKLGAAASDVTLFHVVESLPEYIVQRASREGTIASVADEWAQANRNAGQQILDRHKQALIAAGLPAASLHTKLRQMESLPEAARVAAALAIIEEMQHGDYHVVVVGRRGAASRIDSFLGGVAEKIARAAGGRTVCIVD